MYAFPVQTRVDAMHPSIYQQNQEILLNQRVCSVFDEFHELISKPFKLHPSEEVNQRLSGQMYNSLKIYEIINYYHGYCKLCSRHYYSRSVINDINSYFQRHLNSYFHITCKALKSFPDDQPIFEWENWLVSGHCNVCQMKGIHAFVIQSELKPNDLLKLHECSWSQQDRLRNDKFLTKIQVLRTFCSLKVFADKFIKSTFENGKDESVCILCYKLLLGSGEKATHHLVSAKHFGHFCSFVWKTFNFTPNDLLNGYNLETVIRWGLTQNYPAPMFIVEKNDEHETCMDLSYSDTDLYDEPYCGFSPMLIGEILKIQNCDFIKSAFCLLCNEHIEDYKHMASDKHIQKSADLTQFYEAEEYAIYLNNREKRLRSYDQQIKMYRNLKREALCYGLHIGMPWSPELDSKLPRVGMDPTMKLSMELSSEEEIDTKDLKDLKGANDSNNGSNTKNENKANVSIDENESGLPDSVPTVSVPAVSVPAVSVPVVSVPLQPSNVFTLMTKKLERVNQTFTKVGRSFSMCEVCDQYLSLEAQEQHVLTESHKEHIEKWKAIITNFKYPKFLEPVQSFEYSLGCFICGKLFREWELVNHLKGSTHLENFTKYEELSYPIPISQCFKFDENNSCICINCDSQVNTKNSVTLDQILPNIKTHYPCGEANCKRESLKDINNWAVVAKNENENENENDNEPEMSFRSSQPDILIFCSICGLPFKETFSKIHCPTCAKINSFNFDIAQSTLDLVMNLFETQVVESVMENSTNLISKLFNKNEVSSSSEGKTDAGKNLKALQPETHKEVSVVDNSNTPDGAGASTTSIAVVKVSAEVTVKNNINNNNNNNINNVVNTEEDEGEPEVETEILLIMDVPDVKEKCHKLYLLFRNFGQIRFMYCKNKTGILQFDKRGPALVVSTTGPHFVEGYRLSLACVTRKITKQLSKRVFDLQVPKSQILSPLNPYIRFLVRRPMALQTFLLQLNWQSEKLRISEEERKREKIVCEVIIEAIKSTYPRSKCYLFGSRLSGLNISNSDLDVFLDCGQMFEGDRNTGYNFEKKALLSVSEALKAQADCDNITVVQRARVPIVSFTHIPTDLRCDISFKNGLGVQNTLLIKYMISLDWRVKPLILFLKYWTVVNELHGPPYFSSYAIAMMVIFFLEQGPFPILPTIENLQVHFLGKRVTIGGWDCSFSTDPAHLPKVKNAVPLPVLFIHFFEFYAGFNYEQYVISPLTGRPLCRDEFEKPWKLPMPYKRHAHNIPSQKFITKEIPMCLIDPFDLSHILTKNFPKHDLLVFIHLCKLSAYDLKRSMGFS